MFDLAEMAAAAVEVLDLFFKVGKDFGLFRSVFLCGWLLEFGLVGVDEVFEEA